MEKKSFKNYIYLLLVSFLLSSVFLGCGKKVDNKIKVKANEKEKMVNKNVINKEIKKLEILVSNKLLYYSVKDIVKDSQNVDYIFYKDKNQLYIKHYYHIDDVPDLFIYDNKDTNDKIKLYINKIENDKVGIINAARGINSKNDKIEKINGEYNDIPYWQDINNYKVILVNIKNSIIERDPLNREFYEKNFNEKVKQLKEYEKLFKENSSELKKYNFIVEGNKLDYFLNYNGLKYTNIYEELNEEENELPMQNYKELPKYNISDVIEEYKDEDNIFLYNDDNFIRINKDLINKYNIQCVKFGYYDNSDSYLQILNKEKELLEKLKKVCKD